MRNRKSFIKNKLNKKSRKFKIGGGKKEELKKQIEDTENEIESLEMSLAYGPQTATGYRMYEAHSKVLNDKRKALLKEYDDLFTPEELVQRKAQEAHELDIKKQQDLIEMEQKATIEKQRLAERAIREAENRVREQEESARMRSWIDSSLQKYKEHITNFITENSQNKELLESELQKLENDWDETTRYGQPMNAAYLYKTYSIKKNLLTDAIKKL
jgi:hypothetical protein